MISQYRRRALNPRLRIPLAIRLRLLLLVPGTHRGERLVARCHRSMGRRLESV